MIAQNKNPVNNPLDFGWAIAYRNTEYNLSVFTLAHFKMMSHPDKSGWIVEDSTTGQQHHYMGTLVAQITSEIKSQLPSPTADESIISANLIALKHKFDSLPTTTASLPRPFPKIKFSPETLAYLKQQEELTVKKNKLAEIALQTALKPDPINRCGNFNRNLNNKRY